MPSPASKPTPSFLRRAVRGGLVSLITLLLLLVVGEVWLRATGHRAKVAQDSAGGTMRRWTELMGAGLFRADDDPVRRYALRPGAQCKVGDMTFRVSARGTRGADLPSPKPADEKRLLCVGDSFTFGLWCDEEETLVARLAQMATARERALGTNVTWRPVNLGVPGYHSGQQAVALREDGLALEPDAVVIYFTTNDIQRFGFLYDEDYGLRTDNLPVPLWFKKAAWHSHLYGWIARRHFQHYSRGDHVYLDPHVPWAHVREENQAFTRAALAEMVEVCRAHDLPVFLINQPEPMWSLVLRDRDWNYLPLVQWVEGVRTDLELPGCGLLGWARGYSDGVDRVAGSAPGEAPPADFLLEEYFADERTERIVAFARAAAAADGKEWRTLPVRARLAYVGASPEPLPEKIDFHFNAAGYEHIARLVYPRLREAGVLP